MRGTTGGYYANLMRMYEYLGIPLHSLHVFFAFAKAQPTSSTEYQSAHAEANLHQLQPPGPANPSLVSHVLEILYLITCYFWFSAACFCVPPRTSNSGTTALQRPQSRSNAQPVANGETAETFSQYLQRIWLPRRYVTHYLLPLISSASTCSHAEVMSFPAIDIVNYENLSRGRQHYAVCGGVHQVQSKLANGITDIRLGSRVVAVEPVPAQDGAVVRWIPGSDTEDHASEQYFDRVVLAVSPNVASRLFSPLLPILSKIPTVQTESSVFSPEVGNNHIIIHDEDSNPSGRCSHHDGDHSPPQVITFRTTLSEAGPKTESFHVMPNGVLVRTRQDPAADMERALHTAKFTRTLRTIESRTVVQNIMRASPQKQSEDTVGSADQAPAWVNGQDNVWLVGAWCWDGLVLLEGCVVSAMRIADDFGVEIPWRLGSVPGARCRGTKALFLGVGRAALEARRQISLAAWAVAQQLQHDLKHKER